MAYIKSKSKKSPQINSLETSRTNQNTDGLALIPPSYDISAADQPSTIQPQLIIDPINDKYEREADHMANLVTHSQPNQIRKTKCTDCEQTERLQRQAVSDISAVDGHFSGSIAAPPGVTQQLRSSRSEGVPLPQATRTEMQSIIGSDFSKVRVHTDANAIQMNRDLNAQAFTQGADIYFNQGEYNPSSSSGKHLLAHELTHVVQQLHLPQSMIQRRLVGTFRYRSGTGHLSGTVEVRSRSVGQWQDFLRNNADEEQGNIELNAFMAAALGHARALGGYYMTQNYTQQDAISETDALNLMIAFLTVSIGQPIDLPDWSHEGFPRARSQTAILMSEFNARYAGPAILRLTEESGEFGTDQFNTISAYSDEAESQAGQTPHFMRQNPVYTLVSSALGTAIGATTSLNTYNQMPPANSPENRRIHSAYNLIANSGKVIKATIEQAQQDRNTTRTVLMTVFKAAVASVGVALSAPTGGTSAAVAAGAVSILSPVAEAFLDAALSGNGRTQLRSLLDQYNRGVDRLVSGNPPLLADFAANAKDAFERGLDF